MSNENPVVVERVLSHLNPQNDTLIKNFPYNAK